MPRHQITFPINELYNVCSAVRFAQQYCKFSRFSSEKKSKLLLGIMYSLSRDINVLSLQQNTSNIFFDVFHACSKVLTCTNL